MGELIGAILITRTVSWLLNVIVSKLKGPAATLSRLNKLHIATALITISLGSLGFQSVGYACLLYSLPLLIWYLFDRRRILKGPKKTPTQLVNKSEASKKQDSQEQSDADTIYAQVKGRKKEAESKGLRGLVEGLYRKTEHYPSWIKHSPRNYVPPMILEANEVGPKNSKERKIQMRIAEGDIEFCFKQTNNFDNTDYGDLELKWNGKLVFVLDMAKNWEDGDQYVGPEWHSFQIDSYIPGDWEEILAKLQSAIEENERKMEKAKHEDPEKLAELRKKFGL